MNAPQIVWIVWMSVHLGVMVAVHGKPTGTKYNFWISLMIALTHCALLWWGGFFGGAR